MSASEILEQIRRLPVEEQQELARRVWDEFLEHDELTPEQVEELEQRAERLARNPEVGIPWERVRAELKERLKARSCAAE